MASRMSSTLHSDDEEQFRSPGCMVDNQAGAVIALAAVVIGRRTLAGSSLRRAFTSERSDLRLLLVPVYAFVALVVYLGAMSYLSSRTALLQPSGSSTGASCWAALWR